MTEKYYKWTAPGGQAPFANGYRYPLPVKNADGSWTPGEWTDPAPGELEMCANGYHVCRADGLIHWINAELYECEIDGDRVADESKLCVRRIRLTRRVENWNARTARLFAVWCARQALALMPEPDPRSVAAISTAERFAYGRATAEELDAARAAAWDVAFDEARAAQAAARAAAWDAARNAALAAAWSAAGDVAGAALAAAWATARVTGAAGAAAWAAARNEAGDAALAAAWAAARAARDAARAVGDAARAAQNAKLLEMIEEG